LRSITHPRWPPGNALAHDCDQLPGRSLTVRAAAEQQYVEEKSQPQGHEKSPRAPQGSRKAETAFWQRAPYRPWHTKHQQPSQHVCLMHGKYRKATRRPSSAAKAPASAQQKNQADQ
jgi:hypothetical protein